MSSAVATAEAVEAAAACQPLSDAEFERFRRFIFDAAGITLSTSKKALVSGRLARRLAHHGCSSYGAYLDLLQSRSGGDAEQQVAVDLLTTNETYFFREARHFDALRQAALAAQPARRPFRVWSAACSSGEEAYSIAMVLADCLGTAPGAWEVLGSDISSRMLRRARTGHYPVERTRHIPAAYLRSHCLRGTGAQEGTLLVDRGLRGRVAFEHVNLNDTLPSIGPFDVVFLRNVMIYFSVETKRQVVSRVVGTLRPGGLFCIGHSESLNDLGAPVRLLAPSIYAKA